MMHIGALSFRRAPRVLGALLGIAAFGFPLRAFASGLPQSAAATFHAASQPGLETALLPTLDPTAHAANLLVLRDGDVLCFWFSGTAEGQSNVGIVASRLPRGSRTWQRPLLIDRKEGKSYQNPVPFQAPGGRIWLLHTQQDAGQGQANAQVLRLVSGDNGRTWSKPEILFATPGSFTRQPPVLMDEGAWLLPMYVTPSASIVAGALSNYSLVQISRDSGATWRACPIPASNGLVQPSVVRLGPTAYRAFLRSRSADWIYESSSSDGCNWTPPHPTVLPNNNSSIQAIRLRDGHLVLAFNNSSGPSRRNTPQSGPRFPLSVALSSDEGKTWTQVRDLETDRDSSSSTTQNSQRNSPPEFSYPSLVQLPDGRILIAYTWRRVAIKAALFSEHWLQMGATTGEFKPRVPTIR
jgi:predicted neuraminidase